MRKFILTMVIAFMMAFTANAQIATENAKLFDNTYVGVEAGVQTPLNFNSVFPLNAVAGIKIGKELTPVFGLEVEGMVGFGDNLYNYGYITSYSSQDLEGAYNLHKYGINTFVKTTNVGLNGVINWSNLLFSYNGTPRFFEVKTNTGIGWMHYFGRPDLLGVPLIKYHDALTAKTAVDFAFNLGKTKAHTITVSPGVYWNLTADGHVKFDKTYAQLGLMVGYAYHFKTSNGTRHFKTYDIGAMNDEINRLNAELAKKPKEVVREVVKTVEVPATKAVEHETGFGIKETVFFAYNSAELDANAKETLDKLGENGIYVVRGYASSEGSTEYNKALSLKRAEAVANYLRERGARVDTVEGLGVVFGPTTGRVAVVTTK